MKTNKIEVSIIVPLYHGNRFLKQVINNIYQNVQTSKGFIEIELILVNDSPEEPLIESYISEQVFPISVLTNNQNVGIQSSRLNGLNAAKGEYVLFLDQDDEIADDAIISLYRAIGTSDMAVSDWRIEQLKGDSIITIDSCVDVNDYSLNELIIKGNVVGPPGHCLIKRASISECWKQNILKINGADDYLLWLGMISDSATITRCNKFLYTHKYEKSSCSNDEAAMLESEDEAFRAANKYYGLSAFRRCLHKRSIRYRMTILAHRNPGIINWTMRKIILLAYPERIAFELLNRMKRHLYIHD